MSIKVRDDQSEMELGGSAPVRYSPRVLANTGHAEAPATAARTRTDKGAFYRQVESELDCARFADEGTQSHTGHFQELEVAHCQWSSVGSRAHPHDSDV
jgi:hypothetical protein